MKLTLAQKGPIAPPPTLAGSAARVALEVARWPGVVAATHWHLVRSSEVDGADFYIGGEELGHIHLDGEVHLASVSKLSAALVAAGYARPFRFGGSYAGWVEASIGNDADADAALFMFRLNYQRLGGVPMPALLHEIEAHALAKKGAPL